MGIKSYFLECVNTHLRIRQVGNVEAAYAQDRAWKVPEEAIPRDDPGTAAQKFVHYCLAESSIPEWLQAHYEAEKSRGKVPEPF